MEAAQKVVRRIRFDRNLIDTCREYFPGTTLQRLVELALENEIQRKRKKRTKIPF